MQEDTARGLIAIYFYNNNKAGHCVSIRSIENTTTTMNEEIDLKRKLVETTNAVRKKFKQIKAAKVQNEDELEKFYEPITKPLTSISNVVNHQQKTQKSTATTTTKAQSRSTSMGRTEAARILEDPSEISSITLPKQQSFETSTPKKQKKHLFETPSPSNESTISSDSSSSDSIIHGYLNGLKSTPSKFDSIYGVRFGIKPNKAKTYIGNAEVRFTNGRVALYRKERNIAIFDGSSELYDLLFLKYPPVLVEKGVGELDKHVLQMYKDILDMTNAAYTDYSVDRGLRETRWNKYVEIIKPLIMGDKRGGGAIKRKNMVKKIQLPSKKHLSSQQQPDYIYWNTPGELVDRLRLLCSSKMAGHSGHDNEIMSIIEELREEGIIY